MNPRKIDFNKLEWAVISGAQYKSFQKEGVQLRVVEFFDDFEEIDWCQKGHIGYVLEGRLQIDFDGQIIEYRVGDGIWITEGENDQHKARVPKGESAKLILFEKLP